MKFSDLKKLSFLSFLEQFSISGKGTCNITSMIGGKYFIPENYGELFCSKYDEFIQIKDAKNLNVYLQELVPPRRTKIFIDVDLKEEELSQRMVDQFKNVIHHVFKLDDIKLEILENNVYKTKKHVFALSQDKNIICSPFILDYITYLVGSDKTKGLRLPESLKKEGKDAGVYRLPFGKNTIDYSLQFHNPKTIIEAYELITLDAYEGLRVWYERDEPKKLKKHTTKFKTINEDDNDGNCDDEMEEKITWILEKIFENNRGALEEYKSWWYIVQSCKNLNYDPYKLDEICSRIPKYSDSTGVLSQYDHNTIYNYNFGTLLFYLDKQDKKEFLIKYISVEKGGKRLPSEIIKNMYDEHQGLAKIYTYFMKDNIAITSYNKGYIYFWDEDTCLWKKVDDDYIILNISRILSKYVQIHLCSIEMQVKEYEKSLNKDQANTTQGKSLENLKRETQRILKCTKERPYCCNIYKFAKVGFVDEKFMGYLNAESYILPIKNKKVVELKTGNVRARNKKDYFSFECDVDIGNKDNPNVIRFFNDIMSNHEDRVYYFQKLLGYTLSGSTREKHFFICWGDRDNGKSVVMNMMDRILGDYSTVVSK